MLFGAHISVAGGYDRAIDYATSVGCEAIQFFAKSPRQWRAKPMDPLAAGRFAQKRIEAGISAAFTHTAYLINLTTTDEVLRQRSIDALGDELVRGGLLGVEGVVTHTGTDPEADSDAAAYRLAEAVLEAYERAGTAADSTRLLLENTAGAGSTFGCRWNQLGRTVEESGLSAQRLGVCLDTCHAYAYGYAVDTADGWAALLDEMESEVGLDRLGLVHANDCLFELGSRRDRHAWIGDGFIGRDGFAAMVCAPQLADVPAVCEAPGEVPVKDEVNVGRLKALREACGEGGFVP